MGRILDNQEQLKLWDRLNKERKIELEKLSEKSPFKVLTIDSEWMKKGYIHGMSVQLFDSEHDAIEYIDNWNKTHKGHARILSPKY